MDSIEELLTEMRDGITLSNSIPKEVCPVCGGTEIEGDYCFDCGDRATNLTIEKF
jgi:hypothetical protein